MAFIETSRGNASQGTATTILGHDKGSEINEIPLDEAGEEQDEQEDDGPLMEAPEYGTEKERLVVDTDNVNLARYINRSTLGRIGDLVKREYDLDENSRADWKEKAEKALDFATQKVEEKQYPWPQASNVIFPAPDDSRLPVQRGDISGARPESKPCPRPGVGLGRRHAGDAGWRAQQPAEAASGRLGHLAGPPRRKGEPREPRGRAHVLAAPGPDAGMGAADRSEPFDDADHRRLRAQDVPGREQQFKFFAGRVAAQLGLGSQRAIVRSGAAQDRGVELLPARDRRVRARGRQVPVDRVRAGRTFRGGRLGPERHPGGARLPGAAPSVRPGRRRLRRAAHHHGPQGDGARRAHRGTLR